MLKAIKVKYCPKCYIETSMHDICNGYYCDNSDKVVVPIEKVRYEESGAEGDFKVCPDCNQTLPALDAHFHRSGSGHFDYCLSCKTKYESERSRGYTRR